MDNARIMAEAFQSKGYGLISGGTDNHLILLDLRNKGINGTQAEKALDKARITVNKNMVPFDTESPMVTSGIRIGAPAMTTRGFKEQEFLMVVDMIDRALQHHQDESYLNTLSREVEDLCMQFPLYDFSTVG
jgi:glycine hydroxymethyltransferase